MSVLAAALGPFASADPTFAGTASRFGRSAGASVLRPPKHYVSSRMSVPNCTCMARWPPGWLDSAYRTWTWRRSAFSEEWARDIGAALSTRFAIVCRGVEIGPGRPADFCGDDDAAYGNRVFLRHYCVPLAGPDVLRRGEPFHGDARAARGFNGDIGRCLDAWRAGADPRRVARKTLVAAAGVISAHDKTWTTDRSRAARRWAELDPDRSDDMVRLLAWAEGHVVPLAAELDAALEQNGVVGVVVDRFAAEVGLWPDPVESDAE